MSLKTRFARVIESVDALREVIPPPAELVIKKLLPHLDDHARSFIGRSPMALIGTSNRAGTCDVSPRGEAPGGFLVLDEHTLAIGDRPGNRRTDSFVNLLENPNLGLLFLVPGVDETLRVNGRGSMVQDPELFAKLTVGGKPPLLALVIEVEECFFQCAKAFRRSSLWNPATWPDPQLQPLLAKVLKDQVPSCETPVEELDAMIQDAYRNKLY